LHLLLFRALKPCVELFFVKNIELMAFARGGSDLWSSACTVQMVLLLSTDPLPVEPKSGKPWPVRLSAGLDVNSDFEIDLYRCPRARRWGWSPPHSCRAMRSSQCLFFWYFWMLIGGCNPT